MISLCAKDLHAIQTIADATLPDNAKILAYGSRVKGTAHDSSDLDLVIQTPKAQPLPATQLHDFTEALRDSNIPIVVQVLDWHTIPEHFKPSIEKAHHVLREASREDIPQGWRRVKFGDFIAIQRGHDLFKKSRIAGDVPVAGSTGVVGFHNEGKGIVPGITIGRSGSIGAVNYYSDTYFPLNTVLYVTDFKGNNPKFAYYFLKNFDFSIFDSGSVQPSLNRNYLNPAPVTIPGIDTQKAIAHILGTLDDKIEINQQISQTLEEIAKAIFKSWFVDFDPVRAKAEGRPTGLSSEISDLFPDELVDSEIGKIPKGWEVKTVGSISKKETVKVKKFDRPVKVLSAIRSGALQLSEDYFTKRVFSSNIDNYYVVPKFAYAYNPSRINIGSIGMNLFPFAGAVSPVYNVFSIKKDYEWFFQEWLHLKSVKNMISSLCSGSVRQSLKHVDLESISLVMPPAKVIRKFNNLYKIFLAVKACRVQEVDILSELRDTLLPKLVSGKLQISNAEKILERVAN